MTEINLKSLLEAFMVIVEEMMYQNEKYGTPEERDLTIWDYLAIARIELQEAQDDANSGLDILAMSEVTQVAAVLIQCMVYHGPERGHVK